MDPPFSDLTRDIHALLSNQLSIRIDSVDADLFDKGILDSMTLVQLILGLEREYGLELPMHELEIECFSTVTRIAELVASRTRNGARAATGESGGSAV